MRNKKMMKGMSIFLTVAMLLGSVVQNGFIVKAETSGGTWEDTRLVTNGDFESYTVSTGDASETWNDYTTGWEIMMSGYQYTKVQKVGTDHGNYSLNIYNGSEAAEFTMSQTLSNVPAGTYKVTLEQEGAEQSSGLKLCVGGTEKVFNNTTGYDKWMEVESESFILEETADVTISISGTVPNGYWGDLDNIKLLKATGDGNNENASTEIFKDGGLGDNNEDLWSGPWKFEGDTWTLADKGIAYSADAAQGGTSGLGISFNQSKEGTVAMYQTLSALEAGKYTVTGYVKDTNSKEGNVKLYYGDMASTSENQVVIPTEYGDRFSFTFSLDTAKTDYKVGFLITSKAGAWVCLDTLSLTLTEKADENAQLAAVRAELNTLIEECNDLTEDDWRAAEWEALQNDLTSAQEVYNNSAATLQMVTEAKEALQSAMDALKLWPANQKFWDEMKNWTEGKPTGWTTTAEKYVGKKAAGTADNNKTDIWNFYSSSKAEESVSYTYRATESGYYKASVDTAGEKATGKIKINCKEENASAELLLDGWNPFKTAETDVVAVDAGEDIVIEISMSLQAGGYINMDNVKLLTATEEEVNEAQRELKRKELSELKSVIDNCTNLEETAYTVESWQNLQTAINAANVIYTNGTDNVDSITLTAIKSAISELQTQKAALQSANPLEADIYVKQVILPKDFIGGLDLSSYVSLKKSGVKFYDFDGKELNNQEFFNMLADCGVNYIRVRVWNNPYDGENNGYGGGNNDLDTALQIGQWATNAGMKLLVDFHYSDFWADPSKQAAPKAWTGKNVEDTARAVSEYTETSLKYLIDNNVDVGMVQVGNETNNGIAGVYADNDGWGSMGKIFKAGADAVHAVEDEYGKEILVAVHFANPEKGNYSTYAKNLQNANVDYDVFASSYYPYWHGTLENLQKQLDSIATEYDKKVMVAETSWATTLADGDGHANTVRKGNNDTGMAYDFNIYGQAVELRSVIDTIANTTNGIGVFYWEPAWIPVQVYDASADNAEEVLAANKAAWEKYGSGWASSYAKDYDADDAGKWFGGSAVDNQALFDFTGHPLQTLNIFKYVKYGTTAKVALSSVRSASTECVQGEAPIMPGTVEVVFSDGSKKNIAVTWDEKALASAIAEDELGVYEIPGKVIYDGTEYSTICALTISPKNILANPSFEEGDTEWIISDNTSAVQIKVEDPHKGNCAFKFYSGSKFAYQVTQKVTVEKPGKYTFGGYLQGGSAGNNTVFQIFVKNGEEEWNAYAAVDGWRVWQNPTITDIEIKEANTVITVGFQATVDAGCWGTWDDFYLYRTGDVSKKPDPTPEPTPEPGDSSDDSSSSVANSGSAEEAAVDWNEVQNNVQNKVTEALANNKIESVNMNIVCTGETQVPAAVINSIKGTNVTVAFHSGNGVALSISGQDLKNTDISKLQKLDLTTKSNANNIPANVAATKTAIAKRQISVKDTGNFGITVNMHMNVGKENEGKYANMYRYNPTNGRLEYCGSFVVTKNGQAMFAMTRGGDYLVTVTANKVNETIRYMSGDYTVQAGDSLTAIAVRYHMPLAELIRKNPQLTDINRIKPGQQLNIN